MSKADKMFEELGYEIEDEEGICRIYKIAKFGSILTFVFYKNTTDERYKLKIYEKYLSMQELQAINEKCKELRMDISKDKIQFISNNKMHISINFLGEYTIEEITEETQKYIEENKNNPKLFMDLTFSPIVKRKLNLVRAKLW